MGASGHQSSIACAQPYLRFPTDVLDDFGGLCEPQLQGPTDFGWVPGGPGPRDDGATGMGVPGCGHGPLSASLPRGIFRGNQPQAFHACSRLIKAGEGTEFRYQSDGYGALDTAQGLECVDHRGEAPGGALRLECLLQPLETCRVLIDGPHVFLEDDVLRRGGTDDC
jgi:hypothetical protein